MKNSILLRQFMVVRYIQDRVSQDASPGTIRTYETAIERFSKAIGRDARLSDLNAAKYDRFAAWLNDKKYTPDTTAHTLQLFRAVWAYAHQLGLAAEPPAHAQMKARRRGFAPDRAIRVLLAATAPAVATVVSTDERTVEGFLQRYIQSRVDLKFTTQELLENAADKLVSFYGAEKLLTEVSEFDADAFRRYAMSKLAPNTARRLCGRAKQFFRAAKRKRLIAENPFEDMKGNSVRPNRERDFYVTRELAERVLDACPNEQWKAIFALARYGGLRCPSEVLALRWEGILWDTNRVHVPSPKTAYIEGKAFRIMPLFPELRTHLEALHAKMGCPTSGQVIRRPNYKPNGNRKGHNLGTHLRTHLARAGIKAWPKLFQNCRATRETELADDYPLHIVVAWIGNSQAIARDHYLRVTDAHFDRAAQPGEKGGAA